MKLLPDSLISWLRRRWRILLHGECLWCSEPAAYLIKRGPGAPYRLCPRHLKEWMRMKMGMRDLLGYSVVSLYRRPGGIRGMRPDTIILDDVHESEDKK